MISLKSSGDSSAEPILLPLETAASDNSAGSTDAAAAVVAVPAKKVKRLISDDLGDAISLSVDDTLVKNAPRHNIIKLISS